MDCRNGGCYDIAMSNESGFSMSRAFPEIESLAIEIRSIGYRKVQPEHQRTSRYDLKSPVSLRSVRTAALETTKQDFRLTMSWVRWLRRASRSGFGVQLQ